MQKDLPKEVTIRVLSSAYLRLLIFLHLDFGLCFIQTGILSYMYSAYKLNKHGDNIHP